LLTISFVIPAKNEERHIGRTLDSILAGGSGLVDVRDIIVVDHASSDETALIATRRGAKVLWSSASTVGASRNAGAAIATGDVLVFIDADVTLSSDWWSAIADALQRLEKNPRTLTGSHCSVPDDASSVFERYWFQSFKHSRSSHLGSGHLILRRDLFSEIGGFSETLETGEDYDLCHRAKIVGARIDEDARLVVHHHGFPDSAGSFVRREIWHGRGDSSGAKAIWRSTVARVTCMFLALHVVAFAGVFLRWPVVSSLAIVAIALLVLTASAVKFRHRRLGTIFVNAGIYYLYFAGRSIALLSTAARSARPLNAPPPPGRRRLP
jgi:glycosyltransferase involved in cell wall biosynthesis